MKNGLMIVLGCTLWCTGTLWAADAEWPALEKALKGPRLRVDSVSAEIVRVAEDLYPISLSSEKCPKISVEAYRVYGVTVRFEPRRTLKMSIVGGRIANGFDACHAIVAAGPADPEGENGCLLPKSGLSFLQMGRYLFAFRVPSRDAYAHSRALPIVVQALRDFFETSFPKQFIYGPSGTRLPQLVDVGEYLKGGRNPPAAGNAAQQGIAPDGRSPTAPARR